MTFMSSPSHSLEAIKTAMAAKLRWTGAARIGANEIGFGEADVKATIAKMAPAMFYKTMASERNPGLMQDVYRVPSRAGLLYVKFTDDGIAEFMLLSFKRK
jgi:motility quorum-sensing regulator/GCU-specific mRNA interferase toxin